MRTVRDWKWVHRFRGRVRTRHWIYLLIYAVIFLVGVMVVQWRPEGDVVGPMALSVGASLMATGAVGWALFVVVMAREDTAERLQLLDAFGLEKIFNRRSISIRPEYEQRLALARHKIEVLGFGLSSLRADLGKELPDWIRRSEVRILLIDPEAPGSEPTYAEARSREEGEDPQAIQRDVDAFLKVVDEMIGFDNPGFQIRLYRTLPTLNVFRIDSEAFWGPYLAGIPSRNTPTFLVHESGSLFAAVTAHFEDIWESDDFSRPAEAYFRGRNASGVITDQVANPESEH